MKRLLLALALLPLCAAPASALTLRHAHSLTARIGKADVRTGEATGYSVIQCRKTNPARVWCLLREYGFVPYTDGSDPGWTTFPQTVEFDVAVHQRQACLV